MTLLMRDSTTAADIPLENLAAVAGYGDGLYQWSSADWARFPASVVPLVIVVNAWSQGDILDVETGDAIPAQAPGWWDRFNRQGRRRPTIYCNRDTIDAVRAAMAGRGFDWWAATLDGTQDVPGAVAVQHAGEAQTGGHYDESIIHDPTWLGLPAGGSMATLDDVYALDLALYQGDPSKADCSTTQLKQGQVDIKAQLVTLEAKVDALAPASNQAVLDAIAKLQADLDGLTLKKV